MWYSWDVWDGGVLAGRNCAKRHVFHAFPYSGGFAGSESQFLKTGGCGGQTAQDVAKIGTTLWHQSDSEVKIAKARQARSTTFWSSSPQNLHHAVARERFGSQNRYKLRGSDGFLKFKPAKLAPRCGARVMWKSKSKKKKNWQRRSIFWRWELENLHHAVARERLGSQNRLKTRCPDHVLKFKVLFAWQGQGFRQCIHLKIAQTYCNSEVKCLVNMS